MASATLYKKAQDDALRTADAANYAAKTVAGKQSLETIDAAALRPFRAALANRETARCNILHVGDSITWGFRSTNAGTVSLAARWPSVLRDTLRRRFPTNGASTGGFGFQSPRQTYGTVTFTDTTVTNTGGNNDNGYGLDRNAQILSSSSDSTVYTFAGTGADIGYVTYGGGGSFSWQVDSGATTTVSTNASLNDFNTVQVRSLTAGSHTVTLRWVSGGGAFLTGLTSYNGDEATGIGSFVAAFPGVDSAYWSSNTNWINNVPWANPALVTIELGANDASLSNYSSAATFKTHLQTIITNIKTKLGRAPSFVLMPVWSVAPYTGNTSTWADYIQAQYDIAATDPDQAVTVFDLARRVNSGAVGANTNGIIDTADSIHPSMPLGHRFIAEGLAQFIAPQ